MGPDDFNEDLIYRITDFQMEHGLEADGLCGPLTYRRALAVKEAESDEPAPVLTFNGEPKHIIHNGEESTFTGKSHSMD